MNSMIKIIKATIKERIQQQSFYIMLIIIVVFSFLFIPKNEINIQVFSILRSKFIQVGNSTWIPVGIAYSFAFVLPFISFFYFKNIMIVDEKNNILNYVLTSPISRFKYMLAKVLTNAIILNFFILLIMIVSYVYTLTFFKTNELSVYQFFSYFTPLIFSSIFFCSIANFFQCTEKLRNIYGTICFFILFLAYYFMSLLILNPNYILRGLDFSGLTSIMSNIYECVGTNQFNPPGITYVNYSNIGTQQLYFTGIRYTFIDFFSFLQMSLLSFILIIKASKNYFNNKDLWLKHEIYDDNNLDESFSNKYSEIENFKYKSVNTNDNFNILGVKNEIKLMISNCSIYVWVTVYVGSLFCLFLNEIVSFVRLLPIIFLLLTPVFSSLGSDEYKFNVFSMISTLPNGKINQALYRLLGGIIVSFIVSIPLLIKLLICFKLNLLVSLIVIVILIPSVALFLGEIFKTSKTYEVISVLIFISLILNYDYFKLEIYKIDNMSILFFAFVLNAITLLKRIWLSP